MMCNPFPGNITHQYNRPKDHCGTLRLWYLRLFQGEKRNGYIQLSAHRIMLKIMCVLKGTSLCNLLVTWSAWTKSVQLLFGNLRFRQWGFSMCSAFFSNWYLICSLKPHAMRQTSRYSNLRSNRPFHCSLETLCVEACALLAGDTTKPILLTNWVGCMHRMLPQACDPTTAGELLVKG